MAAPSPTRAVELVEILAHATNKKLDEDQARHFVEVFRHFDEAVALAVVERLRGSDQFFPSEARIRYTASEVIADLAAADDGGPRPQKTTAIPPKVASAQLRVLREVMSAPFQADIVAALNSEAGVGGWDDSDRAKATAAIVYDRVVEETGREPFPDPAVPSAPRVSYRCLECQDTGFVTVDADAATVAPCRVCRPDGHARWEGGHYALNHSCSECAIVRRTGALPAPKKGPT